MSRPTKKPSPRAQAIAAELAHTGRAAGPPAGFIRAGGDAATYGISDDGARLFRGEMVDNADELQPGFIEAMARAGAQASEGGMPPSGMPS